MNADISTKISCFIAEMNGSLAGSSITVEWTPSEFNGLHFNVVLNNPFLVNEAIWTPSDVFRSLLEEKVDKYFNMNISYNNTGTIFRLN